MPFDSLIKSWEEQLGWYSPFEDNEFKEPKEMEEQCEVWQQQGPQWLTANLESIDQIKEDDLNDCANKIKVQENIWK